MRLIPGPRIVDDAFITFRYARNLLAGHGLVYNPGEWVLGTTTPLYALILAFLGLITGEDQTNFPLMAMILNAFFDALTCYILIRIGESLNRPPAGTSAGLIWAVAPMSVSFAIGGMETSLAVLLITSSFYFHIKQRHALAAFIASLSVLTRPDALIFVLLIGMDRAIRALKKSATKPGWIEIAAFVIPLGFWVIISTAAYGSPIPQSITAKTSAYFLPRQAGLIRLLQHFATPFFGHEAFGVWWIGLGLLLFPTLYIVGWRYQLKDNSVAWPLAAYPIFYFGVFAYANPLLFRWYLTPPLPMYFLGIFLGVAQISLGTNRRIISATAVIAAFMLTINAWTMHPDHGPDRPAPEMAYIRLETFYQQAADLLAPRLADGDTLAAGDIGVLGYQTDAHILDTVGLVTPGSAQYYPLPEEQYVINYAIPADLIVEQRPEFIVVLEAYIRETALKNATFKEQYWLLSKLDADLYGSRGMLIFERR
jgi:hypothetical protein